MWSFYYNTFSVTVINFSKQFIPLFAKTDNLFKITWFKLQIHIKITCIVFFDIFSTDRSRALPDKVSKMIKPFFSSRKHGGDRYLNLPSKRFSLLREPPQKVVIFQAPFLKSTPSWNTVKMLFKDSNYAAKLPSNFKYQNIDVKCS